MRLRNMNPTKKHRLRCCGRESSSCSISGICNGTLVRNTVTVEESRMEYCYGREKKDGWDYDNDK